MLSRVIRGPLALAGLSLLLLAGCIFSPDRKPPKDVTVIYPVADSPGNTLQKLILAYNNRDSVRTGEVYDVNYQGSSADPSQPTPVYQFTRASEISHVKRLHDDQNIVNVSLDLGPSNAWQLLPGLATDPPGTIVIPIQYATISVKDVSAAEYVFKPVTMEYAFKPTEISPGVTHWTVIRWTETAN